MSHCLIYHLIEITPISVRVYNDPSSLLLLLLCMQVYPILLKHLSLHYLSRTLNLTYHLLNTTNPTLVQGCCSVFPSHQWATRHPNFHIYTWANSTVKYMEAPVPTRVPRWILKLPTHRNDKRNAHRQSCSVTPVIFKQHNWILIQQSPS